MSIRHDPEDNELNTFLAMAGDLTSKSILEIGCGHGRFTQKYAHLTTHVTGIDPNADKIAQAQEKDINPSASFLANDIGNYQSTQQFDVVLFSWSL